MNVLKAIIERLNQKLDASNLFPSIYGIASPDPNNAKSFLAYDGNGQNLLTADYDKTDGTCFWTLRSAVSVRKADAVQVVACQDMYVTTFPLRAYTIVKKTSLPCDSNATEGYVMDMFWKYVQGKDTALRSNIGVTDIYFRPVSVSPNTPDLPKQFEYVTLYFDLDVEVTAQLIEGCYDECGVNPIPLPDGSCPPINRVVSVTGLDTDNTDPSRPIVKISVDGTTIIGEGTPANPLIAIGGGGGGGALIALPFTTDHLAATGNAYAIGNIVWYLGNVYRCIAANDSILPTNTTYWVNLGAGFATVQQPSDWNASSGNNQILNKPNIPVLPSTIVESVTATAPLTSSGGANPDLAIPQATASDDGYLDSADWSTFNGKFDVPTGTNTDYLDGTGTPTPFPTIPTGTVTSVDLTMPAAFSVTGNPVTTSGTLAVAAAGLSTQYIRGDGQLANFPTSGGGGSSLNYYLNGSVSQGTLDGVAFKQMSSTPVIGGGTNFSISSDGYIESFITDASVPNQLAIPAGNWLFEMYFQANNSGGSPRFYVELWKLSAGTLSLISSSVTNPEFITNGNQIDLYTTALAVPSTVLLAADRLAIRVYVITSGKTITLHTENSNLCEVITTFSTGINALNGLTVQVQNLAVGTSGTDFAISSASSTHTFNLPTASASNRGALSSGDWSTFNGKFNTPSGTTAQYVRGDGSLATFPTAPTIYKSTTDQTAVTGVTTNTKVVGVLIPANTITTGAIVEIKARAGKTGSIGLMTLRVYANTADSIVSPAPTLLTTSTTPAPSSTFMSINRIAVVKSSINTQTAQATVNIISEFIGGTASLTNSNIDWTVAQYIIFAIQNSSALDSTVLSYYEIEIK
jgi:hypothetical protein